jgi:hypothetical protein
VIQQYTGKRPYDTNLETGAGRLLVAIACTIEQFPDPVHAVLDTASEWCVLPALFAEQLGIGPANREETAVLSTRLGTIYGQLFRLGVTFVAAEGEPLTIDATCFVSAEWPGPMVVGWRGCLERMRFGFDTTEEAFYFGGA